MPASMLNEYQARHRSSVPAYANAGLARLCDFHTANLSGYGRVSQGLAAQLDLALDQIASSFEQLARPGGEGEAG